MKAVKLAGLKPESVFACFEALCGVPHGSGNTKKISDFLCEFARERNISYVQDELNNVIFFQEGTCGYEDHRFCRKHGKTGPARDEVSDTCKAG